MRMKLFSVIVLILFIKGTAFGAVGCTLNDPDRDIRRLFPSSTGFKTHFITIGERGGKNLGKEIEKRLGESFEPVYETLDVPYAYYQVFQGANHIGWVFGVNQKGEYGGLQLILATDLKGRILELYYQRISSPESSVFRKAVYREAFKGLTLEDFFGYDPLKGEVVDKDSLLARIKNPSKRNDIDFRATLRGTKKALILFDNFWLNGKAWLNYNLNP